MVFCWVKWPSRHPGEILQHSARYAHTMRRIQPHWFSGSLNVLNIIFYSFSLSIYGKITQKNTWRLDNPHFHAPWRGKNGENTLQVSSQAGFRWSWVKPAQVRWLKQSGRVCVTVCDLHQLQDALYFSSSVFKGLKSVKKLRKMPNNIRPGFKMVSLSLSLPPSSVWDFKAWCFSSRNGVWRAHMISEGSGRCSCKRCEGCGVDHVVSLRWFDAVNKARSLSHTHALKRIVG